MSALIDAQLQLVIQERTGERLIAAFVRAVDGAIADKSGEQPQEGNVDRRGG